MSFDGYISVNGLEIVNAARVQAYTRASGVNVMQNKRVLADYSTIPAAVGVAAYTTPAADSAPWYSAVDPKSADFLGVFPISVTNLTDSTRSSNVTESIGDGGAPGFGRAASRDIKLSLGLVALDDAALELGLRYLKNLVNQIDDDVMMAFVAKPDPANLSRTRRRLYDVSVTSGPLIVDQRTLECYSIMQVEIMLNAGNPYLYSDPVAMPIADASTSGGAAPHDIIWDKDFASIRNIIQNPSFYLGDNYWTTDGNPTYSSKAVVALPASLPFASSTYTQALRQTWVATAARGATFLEYTSTPNRYNAENEMYSFSAWVYSTKAKKMRMAAGFTSVPGVYGGTVRVVGPDVVVPANTWTRIVVQNVQSGALLPDGDQGYPQSYIQISDSLATDSAQWVSGDRLYVTAVSGHVGNYAFPYFDGQAVKYPEGFFPTRLTGFQWASKDKESTSIAQTAPPLGLNDYLKTNVTPPPVPPQIDSDDVVGHQTFVRYYYPIAAASIPRGGKSALIINLRMEKSTPLWIRDGMRVRVIKNPLNLTLPNALFDPTAVVAEFTLSRVLLRGNYTTLFLDARDDTAIMSAVTSSSVAVTGDASNLLYAADGGPFVTPEISNEGPVVVCLDVPLPPADTPALADAVGPQINRITSIQLALKE